MEDISKERLIVVGKIKRIVKRGESRKLVDTEAVQLLQMPDSQNRKTPDQTGNEIAGPALELDILAIYR